MREGSYAGLKDACYWSSAVKGAKQRVYLSAGVKGTVADLKAENLTVQTKGVYLDVQGSVKGLTDVKDTYFDVQVNDLTASVKDFSDIDGGTLTENITLPDMVKELGDISLNGNFKGKLEDFKADFSIVSDLGLLDLHALAEKQSTGLVRYDAFVSSPHLNAGKFLGGETVGSTALQMQASLTGTQPEKMTGYLDASLYNAYINKNSYDVIKLKGEIKGYDITADVEIKDEYAVLNADCYVNYSGKPTVRLDAKAKDVNLHKLNLYSFADTNTIVSLNIKAGVYDFDIDRLNCDAELSDREIGMTGKSFGFDNITFIASSYEDINTMVLNSQIMDAHINGRYTMTSLGRDFTYLIDKYIPDFSYLTSNENKEQKKQVTDTAYTVESQVDFNVKVKNADILRSLFDTELYLRKEIEILGFMNADTVLSCTLNAPWVTYSNMDFRSLRTDINAAGGRLASNIYLKQASFSDSLAFENIYLNAVNDKENINLSAGAVKQGDSLTDAHIVFDATVNESGLNGKFSDTYFDIQGERISFNNNHALGLADNKVSVINLAVNTDKGSINIDGEVSGDNALRCRFDNLDLSLVNPFIESSGMSISGTLNREVVLNNILESFTFTSSLTVDDLTVNDVYLGHAGLKVDNTIDKDVFNTDIKFLYVSQDKEVVPLQIYGTVAPASEKEQLDLNVSMQNFSLAVIRSFISSFASEVEGSLSCNDLKVKGKLTSPDIEGVIHCNNAALKVNMLNTKYRLDDDILIQNNKIVFSDFKLKDAEQNKITLNGDVTHHDFEDFDINLEVVAEKIKILDTKSNSDEMYYGTAYASANMNINGNLQMINITGSAKTEAGTSLTVPVTSKENAQENEFIIFVDNKQEQTQQQGEEKEKNKEQSVGYNISIDLNVNPNAHLYIPMDFSQLKGDLSAAGNGDLKIDINSDGKFSMIGEVAIDNGNFKFNIMDVMEKNFVLEKGGTLTWNGEPAGGILDVTAIYKTKASLSTILGGASSKPVDVESIIRLSGVMTNPQPSFDINLPNTDEQTAEQVFMNIDKSSEKVMLEQTASILLTNQFYNSQGGYETGALQSGVTSSVMGVAFSQLSGMITNMVKIVDVGLSYTSSGTGTAVSDQLDINVSKSFGKWEIDLNSSLGGSGETYQSSQTTNIIGDMSAKYKYTDNLQFELFNHSNANDFTKYNISPYTQGARIIYKKEYNTLKEVFRRKNKDKKQDILSEDNKQEDKK